MQSKKFIPAHVSTYVVVFIRARVHKIQLSAELIQKLRYDYHKILDIMIVSISPLYYIERFERNNGSSNDR